MSKKAAEQFPILLVDDEVEILFSTSFLFQSEGFANVTTENDSRHVMEVLNRQDIALIILDLNMPYLSGFELLKGIRAEFPHIPVIVMTAANEVEMAVQCMHAGAFDYLDVYKRQTRLPFLPAPLSRKCPPRCLPMSR